jgi:hypothetical protein
LNTDLKGLITGPLHPVIPIIPASRNDTNSSRRLNASDFM